MTTSTTRSTVLDQLQQWYATDGDDFILTAPAYHPNADDEDDELYFRLLFAAVNAGWMKPMFG